MDVHGEQPAVGVGQDVALAPTDLLTSVVAFRTPLIGGANRLAVEDRRARRGFAADAFTVRHHQGMVDTGPDALPLPAAEIK